jgi:flagella basal body P-ring formation protein FlgA
MTLFFSILLILSSVVLACEITLPHRIVIVGQSGNCGGSVRFSECTEEVERIFNEVLTSLEGKVSSKSLVSMMANRGHEISLTPASLQIQQLRSLIREELPLPQGVHVKRAAVIDGPDILALDANDKVDIQCSQCLYGSQQVININLEDFNGIRRSITASADFRKMVRAFRVNSSLTSFSAITENDLREEYTDSVPYTDLLTDTDALRFYKTNKFIKAGELLRFADLNAVNLVKAGLKTEVILENALVKIKTQGISRSNGAIGDLVEVYHPQKNKKYQGKVIDSNKVLVEL